MSNNVQRAIGGHTDGHARRDARDTSVLGGLGKGTETLMLLANRGDTLERA